MSIKDNIKQALLNLIQNERENLDARIQINVLTRSENLDTISEQNFLDTLERFANSI